MMLAFFIKIRHAVRYAAYPVLTSLLLTACMSTPPLPDQQRPQHWGTVINSSHNFHQISQNVFRSEQPNAQLLPDLEQYEIQTIINLRRRDRDHAMLASSSYNLVHIPIDTWSIDREDLLKVMREIQIAKRNHQRVLIHCYHGSDRTGASIAMYRIIFEQWSIEDALNEMKYGGYGFHPIWINIENLFRPEHIKWIREQLSNPS